MRLKKRFLGVFEAGLRLALAAGLVLPAGGPAGAAGTASRPASATDAPAASGAAARSAAPQATTEFAPAAAQPLAVAKAQSAFSAGGLVAVTYIVRNTLPPETRPAIAPGADVTATVDALLATDFAADPNTVRGAVLALELTGPGATLHSASLPAAQAGAALAFNLGDVPPLGEASVVVTVTTPASTADFADLDTGARALGNWRGRPVSAQAGAIRLAPDGLAQWLACTPDANCADPVVVRQAGTLGNAPSALFDFVRGLGYEAYAGSLRGARGTLWSAAGNGYDQASLLIALLRASGIPAAYRLGTLSPGDAQALIESMFPAVPSASGLVPAGALTADPANEAALLAEAQQHAWVEAYLPGSGWTALDPSFGWATAGQVFGTPTGGQLVELPDADRHKVTLALEVEKYSAFPVGGTNLYRTYPLTATLNAVELVGEPVVFAHLVDSSTPPGMVFATAEHTYTPYFIVGVEETLIEGAPFAELISNFPFGQDFVVAEWLRLTVTSPDGASHTYQRELFDDIGYTVRTQGGLVGELARDATPRVSPMSSWNTLFSPSEVPLDALNDTYQSMVTLALDGIAASEAIEGVGDTENPTPEEVALATDTAITYGLLARLAQRQHLLQYAAAADHAHDALAGSLLVRAYPDSPRVFTVGWERNDTTLTDHISFDLGRNTLRALAYPGQTATGVQAFNFWRGLLDMSLEHELLAAVAPEPVVSVTAVFLQAIDAGIEFERITPGTLDTLDALPISDQAKARIATALAGNPDLFVLVPAEMVTLPGAAEPTIGWLQVDQNTLEAIDVMENGQHVVAVNYAVLGRFAKKIGSFLGGFSAGFFGYVMGFWAGFFGQMPLDSQDIESVIAASKAAAQDVGNEAKLACWAKADRKWCKKGVGAGISAGAAAIGDDPPLQAALFNLPVDVPAGSPQASATVGEAATLGGSSIAASTTTSLAGAHGPAGYAWTTAAPNSFAFDTLTASAAQVFSGGALAATGAVTATPDAGGPALAATNGTVEVDGSATGALALHADPGGLLAGSQWASYAFDLDAPGAYTLTLAGAEVSVNGAAYTGALELAPSSPAALAGSGATAAPALAASLAVDAAGTGFTVAEASGSLSVGGGAAPIANGFALGNAQGTAGFTAAGAFSFTGSADFLALTLDSASSAIPADGAAGFDASVAANFAGSHTVSVFAPNGWTVSVDGAGQVTASPPLGAAPGDYLLIVTAQPEAYPDLFVSAEHTVTVTGVDAVEVSVAPDPLITVPWGPGSDVINFDLAEGQVQLAGAAFAATITNASSVARTFDVGVTGLPTGWSILGGEPGRDSLELPLAAGEAVRLGLYIQPTFAGLPAPGTTYPFNVTATAQDNAGVTSADSDVFTMPAVAYPGLSVSPAGVYAASNSEAAFALTVTNLGNTAGDFDLTGHVPVAGWAITSLQSPVSLAPGASAVQTVTVSVTTGEAGVDHPVAIGASVPAQPYAPTVAANLYVVGPLSSPVFEAAVRIGDECPAGWGDLAAALETLALAMSVLEGACAEGDCDLALRDAVVSALEGALVYAEAASPLLSTAGALPPLASAMAGHTSDTDLEADLAAISAAVGDLEAEACELCQHLPGVQWEPGYDAGLPGLPVSYTLTIENQGTLTTTYAVTVSLPASSDAFTTTLAPGASDVSEWAASAAVLGLHDLTAEATALEPDVTLPGLTVSDTARLNVVDRFVQITAVTAGPAFVETGVSSTTLTVDVTNVANVPREATARVSLLAPGGAVSATTDVPLTVLAGAPRTYPLGTFDTSGWAAGVYTVTVDLLDASDSVIPDGSGYGYFAVGQALVASHAVSPTVAAPGALTVTTILTTELQSESPFETEPQGQPPSTPRRGAAVPSAAMVEVQAPGLSVGRPRLSPVDAPAARPLLTEGLTRTEQADAAVLYTGTWSSVNSVLASGGAYARADDPGDTAEFTFTGVWLNLGFLAGPNSGQAEVYIDGESQGVLDLYQREDAAVSFVYGGLLTAPHTVSVTVLGTKNAYAANDHVQLDYVDVWDGTALPDGTFEQDDERVLLSTGWTNINDVDASGGAYARGSTASAWFIFAGESVTYQALAGSLGGRARVYLDGQYQTTVDLYNHTDVTRTLSFDGLTDGPHVLQVSSHYGNAAVDAFITPGVPPFFTPPVPAGFTRYEDDDPALLYNSVPFTHTAQTWGRSNPNLLVSGWTSAGQWIGSDTPGDTVSLTFDGVWVSVGFSGQSVGGLAEIFIDGLSQGAVDLYRNENDAIGFSYGGLVTGTHTLSVTVLGTANPLANGDEVRLDYIDVWDGADLSTGVFEQNDERVLRSSGWFEASDADASGGTYMAEGVSANSTAWFPFTGDSVTFQAVDGSSGAEVVLRLDGAFAGYADIHTNTSPTHTFSFDGLGAGLHVLQVRRYRDNATVDAFHTPAITAPATPTPTTFTRYEEDDPALLYNGLPYTHTARAWDRFDNATYVSDGQYFGSGSDGDWARFDFTGAWVRAGFVTGPAGGQVEVFIDGASQGVVELYTANTGVTAAAFDNLADTSHTLTVTLLSTQHPNASGHALYVDYFDTWDGTALLPGAYEEDDPLVWRSSTHEDWTSTAAAGASGGAYLSRSALQPDSRLWFPFTGDSVTYVGMANSGGGRVTLLLDDVPQGTFNLYNSTTVTRAVSFDGLGAGPHVLEVRYYQGAPTLDAFVTPGAAPFHAAPVYTGVVRYEEDHPDVRYDGYDWDHRPQTFDRVSSSRMSRQWHVSTGALSDTISLTFDGRWVFAGFRGVSGASQARVYIDGADQGVVDLSGSNTPIGFAYGNLLTGTHTISVTREAGTVYFDYFDVWDGQPMADDFQNARLAEDSSRLHYGGGMVDGDLAAALNGDYVAAGLLNSAAVVYYTFVGDSFTFFPLLRPGGGQMDIYLDGVLTDTVDITYPFSEQPAAFHYAGLEYGPHTVAVANVLNLRVDGFASNPASLAAMAPLAEWWDETIAGGGTWGGTISPLAAGDLDGDGLVEIVASIAAPPPYNGTLAVFRGDGQDTGDGDPVLWSVSYPSLVGSSAFESQGAPAIADLDGEGGAEVVVSNPYGVYAYHADGTPYWSETAYPAHVFFGAPAIGNLDDEPLPEIVLNLDNNLVVFEHDGTVTWVITNTQGYFNPVLADLSGDGRLDILANDGTDELFAWDYNQGSPTLLWSQTFTDDVPVYGSPAVADLDGQQPGGDTGPEVAIAISGTLHVLNADGASVWTAPLAAGAPGAVSIADLDGDGESDILASSLVTPGVAAQLQAFNAGGTLLWRTLVNDNTPANASLMDLDGDGAYEVVHVGPGGLSLFSGADGSLLFNEPGVTSQTGLDFTIFADVDLDGHGELVVAAQAGLRVFGWDGMWTEARPVWNQPTYHVTNINDDLSVPAAELNHWETHNTFRTQYPATEVLPVHDVALSHTVGIDGVAVLTETFNVAPGIAADPLYGWDYTQTWADEVVTRTFQSALTGLQPGEARLVAAGTQVTYTLPSGTNYLTLPPLYVSVPHIISLAPETQTAGAGGVAAYAVVLSNPAAAADTYTLTVSGVPGAWADLPAAVPVGAQDSVTVTLTITVPAGTAPSTETVVVSAVNAAGGSDQAQAELVVIDALDVALSPASQTAETNVAVPYTLTVTNHEAVGRTYTLSALGLAQVSLPPTVTVPAGGSVPVEVLATALSAGPHPFTVLAAYSGASDSDTAQLDASGVRAVGLNLAPAANAAGPGATAVYTLTVTNLGSVADAYDLSVDLPAGWSAALDANGTPLTSLALPPDLFNSAQVRLAVTPDAAAAPGLYPVTVVAQSQASAAVTATVTADLEVLARGVQVELSPASQTLHPAGSGQWQVTVTNTGSTADTFDLTASGLAALAGAFSTNPVALGPGASTVVNLTLDDLDFALPAAYPLGVTAVSQADGRVRDEALATATFEAFEAVVVALLPPSQSVDGSTAELLLVITNTSNLAVTFALSLDMPGLSGALAVTEAALPAHAVLLLPLTVEAAAPGAFTVEAQAASTTSAANASATATITFDFDEPPPPPPPPPPPEPSLLFLPLLVRQSGVAPLEQPRLYLPLLKSH